MNSIKRVFLYGILLAAILTQSCGGGGNASSGSNSQSPTETVPVLNTPSSLNVATTNTSASASTSVSVSANVGVTIYWVVVPSTDAAPSPTQIMSAENALSTGALISGNSTVTSNSTVAIPVTGLGYGTSYSFYMVGVNSNNNSLISAVDGVTLIVPSQPSGTPSTSNSVSVQVNGGLQNTSLNIVTSSVTVCVPGTSNCKTVDNVQVDTGSTGLRILASALGSLNLPSIPSSVSGQSVYECAQFADGFTWGGVASAEVVLGGERSQSIGVQVIEDNVSNSRVPSTCFNSGGTNISNATALGANGIIGVGLFLQDCGSSCASNARNEQYFSCVGAICSSVAVPLSSQVSNPVGFFAQDNNGVLLNIQGGMSAAGAVSQPGTLIFGIGTQANNALAGAVTISVPDSGNSVGTFTVTSGGNALSNSFIDSGSSILLFPSTIPKCADLQNAYYCPNSATSVTFTMIPNSSSTVTLSIDNADNLFKNHPEFYVFENVGGPTIAINNSLNFVDFGIPFFIGRSVYTGYEVRNSSPYFAYKP